MITKEQLQELDQLLGKAIRLSRSIEFNINIIYCYVKTKDIPEVFLGKDLNIYKNPKYIRIYKQAEDKSFNVSLKLLMELDKKEQIFTSRQYEFLQNIRISRNELCHDMSCSYLHLNLKEEERQQKYQEDIKKLKRFISDASQYDKLIQKKIQAFCKY